MSRLPRPRRPKLNPPRQRLPTSLSKAQSEDDPALADAGEMGHADMAYCEHVMVKMQMAALEALPPMTQDWMDKLDHIEGAVRHHMYEEEGTWFLELKEKGKNPAKIAARFKEEYERYVGNELNT